MTPSAILGSVEDIEPQRTRRTQRKPTIVVVLLCVLRVLCGAIVVLRVLCGSSVVLRVLRGSMSSTEPTTALGKHGEQVPVARRRRRERVAAVGRAVL